MQSFESSNLKLNRTYRVDKEKWAQLISEWQKSNESQKAFCKRLNLNINTFAYAKEKLLKRSITKKFIPITIQENVSQQSNANIILENTKGIKMHIPLMISEEKLLHLIKIVGW